MKRAERVREVLTTLYHDQPSGLSGNEDVGQMSAWYVMSAMGIYQAFIHHRDIVAGGLLEFEMGSAPSQFGIPERDRP